MQYACIISEYAAGRSPENFTMKGYAIYHKSKNPSIATFVKPIISMWAGYDAMRLVGII